MGLTVEYYFALASPWAYLGHAQLVDICRRHGARIDDLLIDYAQAFAAAGTAMLAHRPPLRRKYRLLELKRWSGLRSVTLNPQPKHLSGEAAEPAEDQAARMCIAAKWLEHDSLKLAFAIAKALWAEEREAFRPEVLLEIARECGLDGRALLSAADAPEVIAQRKANTERAIANGVFGMPTYRVPDDPQGEAFFWGQDRLDFLDRALAQLKPGQA